MFSATWQGYGVPTPIAFQQAGVPALPTCVLFVPCEPCEPTAFQLGAD